VAGFAEEIKKVFMAHFQGRATVGAEIGILGCGGINTYLTMPSCSVWGVDPFIEYLEFVAAVGGGKDSACSRDKLSQGLNGAVAVAKKNLRFVHLHMRSEEAVKIFPHQSLDWVFIDANHSKPFIEHDAREWGLRVKFGGIIAGHDYGSSAHHDVKPAVDALYGDAVQTAGDAVWWVHKK
jgi:hypothetical protein